MVDCCICSYEGLPGQGSALLANASQPLGEFCANFGYDSDAFPLDCLPAGLRCEHYVAVVQVMKQVCFPHLLCYLPDPCLSVLWMTACAAACSHCHITMVLLAEHQTGSLIQPSSSPTRCQELMRERQLTKEQLLHVVRNIDCPKSHAVVTAGS